MLVFFHFLGLAPAEAPSDCGFHQEQLVPDSTMPTERCARPSRPMNALSRWPESYPDDGPA